MILSSRKLDYSCECLLLWAAWGRVRGRAPQLGTHCPPGWMFRSEHTAAFDTSMDPHSQWEDFLLSPLVVAFLNFREVLFHDGALKDLCTKDSTQVPGLSGWPHWVDVSEMCLTACYLTLPPPQGRSTHCSPVAIESWGGFLRFSDSSSHYDHKTLESKSKITKRARYPRKLNGT